MRAFDFLVRDFGFSLPIARQHSAETSYEYRRGETEVDILHVNGPTATGAEARAVLPGAPRDKDRPCDCAADGLTEWRSLGATSLPRG